VIAAMLALQRLDDKVTVAGQLREADVDDLARLGFRALVNNRPDGEALFGQPASTEIHAAARGAQIASHYLPIAMPTLGLNEIRQFRAIIKATDGPVLAYCKSGLRSALLWVLAEAAYERCPLDDLLRQAAAAGQDLSRSRPVIERLLAEFDAQAER